MLGYRDINGEINSEELAMNFVSFMEENKSIFVFQDNPYVSKVYEEDDQFNLYEFYDVKYAFVSDSLILTFYPLEAKGLKSIDKMYMHSANALFIINMRLQAFIFNCFHQKGVFLRGGVSNKYCYVKDNFAVGEGLIDAYLVESKNAKYPRIAFSENVVSNSKLMSKIKFLSDVMYGGNQLIVKDSSDGVYYLDYLSNNSHLIDFSSENVRERLKADPVGFEFNFNNISNYFKSHSEKIQKKLIELDQKLKKSTGDEAINIEKIIEKFLWLKRYHNSVVSKNNLLKNFTID